MRNFFSILGILVLLFALWIILVFAQFPVIPIVTTKYNLVGSTETLGKGIPLKNTPELNVKIEAPEYFEENQQCFDMWFSSNSGKHKISVKDVSQKIINRSELKPIGSYLFWDGGSQENAFSIENYDIEKTDVYENDKYCFFRTVVNVKGINDFEIKLKAKFIVDNKANFIDTVLIVKKVHEFHWEKFRTH